jgi:hypothetical protein
MAHDVEWHREYARLELAASVASEALRDARRKLERKRPARDAQAVYDAALAASRSASAARWDFEMAATKIVDVSTLEARDWLRAMLPRQF